MKILFSSILLFLITAGFTQAQTVSSTSSSSLPDSTLYVVDGKILAGEALKQIPYTKIASVDVVKKDTVVNGTLYRARVFVRLKNEEKLKN
jgi:hypothetical protein